MDPDKQKWMGVSSSSKSIIPFLLLDSSSHFRVHTFTREKAAVSCGSFLSFPPYIQAMTKPILQLLSTVPILPPLPPSLHKLVKWPSCKNRTAPPCSTPRGVQPEAPHQLSRLPIRPQHSTKCSFSLPLVDSTLFLHEEGLFDTRHQELVGRCWRSNHRTPSWEEDRERPLPGEVQGGAGWFSLPLLRCPDGLTLWEDSVLDWGKALLVTDTSLYRRTPLDMLAGYSRRITSWNHCLPDQTSLKLP